MLRVTGWINRFLANVRKHQNDREGGELTSKEIRQAQEQIMKKIQALKDNQPLPTKSTLRKRTLWRTPWIKHSTVIFRWFVRRDEVSNHPSKESYRYQANCEVSPRDGGSRDGSELYIKSFARKVLCGSRTTASKELYQRRCGMQQAIQALSPTTADYTIFSKKVLSC